MPPPTTALIDNTQMSHATKFCVFMHALFTKLLLQKVLGSYQDTLQSKKLAV